MRDLNSLADITPGMHLRSSESRAVLAKADLRKSENDVKRELGRVFKSVQERSGLNVNQFADALGRHPSQVGRWFTGDERAQVDTLLAVDERYGLWEWFLICAAELRRGMSIETETTIRIRRSA